MTIQESDGQMCCASYHVGQIVVKARLLEHCAGLQKHYSIEIVQNEERAVCELGCDFMRARGLFLDVVFGGVTVCTLHDVIEDRLGAVM